jgi:hypothetical protein
MGYLIIDITALTLSSLEYLLLSYRCRRVTELQLLSDGEVVPVTILLLESVNTLTIKSGHILYDGLRQNETVSFDQ